MSSWSNQKVLVAGGTGLIGIPLVELLIQKGAIVRVASLDDPSRAHPEAEFIKANLIDYQNCLYVTRGMDYVFNLLCAKGSPLMVKMRPATFFDTLNRLNFNLAQASLENKVSGYLFTSSVGVYQPAEILREDDVWHTMPSKNDRFAGWAKRMGELQIEAYKIEHGWNNTAIVRPSNVYGPYDNFDSDTALFIASKIRQFAEKEDPIVVWGDGLQVRDFIYSEDAARGILFVAEKSAGPINLCSGNPTTIKGVVEILARNSDYNPKIVFDTDKPSGDKKRLLDVTKLRDLGFEPQISLEEGLNRTLKWYRENHQDSSGRYNIFKANT